jgi:endonuclease/exonuclease/phosphatase family metal-dependent hydrolase
MEFFNDFENFIKEIDNENKQKIIITGDFNCDMLDSNYRNNNSKRLDDLLDIYQLQQHIDKPTRTTDSTKTLIDIIITKSDDNKTSDSGVIALGISDHDLVYICRKIVNS